LHFLIAFSKPFKKYMEGRENILEVV